MNQGNIAAGKTTCEASGCLAAAEEEITIAVGQTAEINLSVCNDCRSKFIRSDSYDNQAKTSSRKVANSESKVAHHDQSMRNKVQPRSKETLNDSI